MILFFTRLIILKCSLALKCSSHIYYETTKLNIPHSQMTQNKSEWGDVLYSATYAPFRHYGTTSNVLHL